MADAEIIKTEINSEPAFVTQDVDMIYMGPMPENIQEVAIRKLRPYKERIEELIKKNVVFLVTGNAVELFGKYIENEDGSKIEALSIFNIYAKRDMMHRHNSIFLGKYEEVEIVGFKSQFTMAYGDNENNYFAEAEKGIGLNKESKLEGIKQNNFIKCINCCHMTIRNLTATIQSLSVLNHLSNVIKSCLICHDFI